MKVHFFARMAVGLAALLGGAAQVHAQQYGPEPGPVVFAGGVDASMAHDAAGYGVVPAAHRQAMPDPYFASQPYAGPYVGPQSACPPGGCHPGGCPTGGCHPGQCGDWGCHSGACGQGGCPSGPPQGLLNYLGFGGGDCHCCPGFDCGWRVRAEYVHLNRDEANDGLVFATLGPAGPVALGGNSFDFDPQSNLRLALEHRVGECDSLEFSYLGLGRWRSGATATSVGDVLLYSPLTGADPFPVLLPGFDQADEASIYYSAKLHNAEVNYWSPLPYDFHGLRASWLVAGFRFLNQTERFMYDSVSTEDDVDDTIGTGSYHVRTRNNLVGAQTGFMLCYPVTCNFGLRVDGKAGYYANFARQSTAITIAGTTAGENDFAFAEEVRDTTGAFIGELNLIGTYRINCCVSIYSGYTFMWVNDLALAPNQFNPNFPNLGLPTGNIHTEGNVLYQGWSFGVEVNY